MPTVTHVAQAEVLAAAAELTKPVKRITVNTNANKERYTTLIDKANGEQPIAAEFDPAIDPTQPIEVAEESGQSDTTEEAPVQEAVKLSPQVTALARKEQQFRQREQAFKAKEQALAEREAKLAKIQELSDKLDAKDFSALKEKVPYEDYTNFLLNEGDPNDPIKSIEAKFAKLEAAQVEAENKAKESVKAQYRSNIKGLVASNPEFSTIKESGAEEHVLQYILDSFEDGITLTPEEAAAEVEQELLADALKMANYTKVKAKQASPDSTKKTLPPPPAPKAAGLRTITQQIAPTTKKFAQSQHLSPSERLAAAVAKAQQKNQ